MSFSCGCMDMWLDFLTLILLTRFSQRGSLVSGGGQWTDHVPHGCSRLIGISSRWGWARHLLGGWPDGGPWSTGGKWTQRRAALTHAPIPDLTLGNMWVTFSLNLFSRSGEEDFQKVYSSKNIIVAKSFDLCRHRWGTLCSSRIGDHAVKFCLDRFSHFRENDF